MTPARRPYDGILAVLDGPTLHALACLADELRRPRFVDPKQAAEELAAMGPDTRPGLGWWRRHLGITSANPSLPAQDLRQDVDERTAMTTTTHAPAGTTYTTLVGTLTCDPELRFSPKGTAWTTFRLAVNRRRRLDDGTYEELAAERYELTCFGGLAEHVAACLATGDRVVAVGRVETERWTGREDTERPTGKLVADDVGVSLRFAANTSGRIERRDQGGCRTPQLDVSGSREAG